MLRKVVVGWATLVWWLKGIITGDDMQVFSQKPEMCSLSRSIHITNIQPLNVASLDDVTRSWRLEAVAPASPLQFHRVPKRPLCRLRCSLVLMSCALSATGERGTNNRRRFRYGNEQMKFVLHINGINVFTSQLTTLYSASLHSLEGFAVEISYNVRNIAVKADNCRRVLCVDGYCY